jgi:hypothetical protein
MAVDLRCPSCKAKLRFDDPPEPGEEIECPKCSETFKAPRTSTKVKPQSKPAKKAPEPPKADEPKKVKVPPPQTKREFMNSFLLLGIVGGIMFGILVVLSVIQYFLNQAGAVVEETVSYVPTDCNIIRGINIKQMRSFPGYASEGDKLYTPELKAAFEILADATGKPKDTLLTYMVQAHERSKDRGEGTLYFFATKDPVSKSFASSIDKTQEVSVQGETCYRLVSANGILNNALVYCPHGKLIALVPNGPLRDKLMGNVIASRNLGRKERTPELVGVAGKLALRGHIWTIIRPTGKLEKYIADTTGSVKKGLSALGSAGEKAKCMSFWISIGGGGVRMAGALELDSKSSAENLVKSMREGPLGKGDESEPPNDFKQAFSIAGQKSFMEFMQYVDYQQEGTCAYFKSKVAVPDNARTFLQVLNGPMGLSNTTSGPGGFGPGG